MSLIFTMQLEINSSSVSTVQILEYYSITAYSGQTLDVSTQDTYITFYKLYIIDCTQVTNLKLVSCIHCIPNSNSSLSYQNNYFCCTYCDESRRVTDIHNYNIINDDFTIQLQDHVRQIHFISFSHSWVRLLMENIFHTLRSSRQKQWPSLNMSKYIIIIADLLINY